MQNIRMTLNQFNQFGKDNLSNKNDLQYPPIT